MAGVFLPGHESPLDVAGSHRAGGVGLGRIYKGRSRIH